MKKLLLCSDKYHARAVPTSLKGTNNREKGGCGPSLEGGSGLHARLEVCKICLFG